MKKTNKIRIKRQREPERSASDRLIDIAEELFVKKGYEKTSIDDILRKAKISKGGFYHHFVSKNEIFVAVVDRHLHAIQEETARIVADKKLTAGQKLNKYFSKLMDLDHAHNHLFSYAFMANDTSLVSQEYFDHSRKLILPLLLKMIDQGTQEGLFKAKYPRETLELLMLMKQSALKFLPELLHDKKKLFRYIEAMNEITEKSLGLKRGFFKNLILKDIKHKP